MESSEMSIHIGNSEYNVIELRIIGNPCPNSVCVDDKNWLKTEITIRVGGFTGKYHADLRAGDFPRFSGELSNLYEGTDTVANIETLEGQLSLTFTRDQRGHVMVAGVCRDEAGIGNTLKFQFDIDQSYIPEVLAEVNKIIVQFPVVRH